MVSSFAGVVLFFSATFFALNLAAPDELTVTFLVFNHHLRKISIVFTSFTLKTSIDSCSNYY